MSLPSTGTAYLGQGQRAFGPAWARSPGHEASVLGSLGRRWFPSAGKPSPSQLGESTPFLDLPDFQSFKGGQVFKLTGLRRPPGLRTLCGRQQQPSFLSCAFLFHTNKFRGDYSPCPRGPRVLAGTPALPWQHERHWCWCPGHLSPAPFSLCSRSCSWGPTAPIPIIQKS